MSVADASAEALWAGDSWVRTSEEQHRWLRQNREKGIARSGPGVEVRWFAPEGCRWPLLCVGVYAAYPMPRTGVQVSVSCKYSADAWFENCTFPPALVGVLIEMLEAVRR